MVNISLTLKQLGKFCENVILFSDFFTIKKLVWNWFNTMYISAALWILMDWCFSTRTQCWILSTPCTSSCLGLGDEINKPYELNWTNINVYHVSAMLKYVTMSFLFHESKQTVHAVNAISDFLCMNFDVKKDDLFFPRNICQAQVFSVFFCVCVHMY